MAQMVARGCFLLMYTSLAKFQERVHLYTADWAADLNANGMSCGVWQEPCILETSAGGSHLP